MFFDTLAQNDSRLIVQVFVQTDRTSHMFWRGIDDQHPLHAADQRARQGCDPLDLRRGRPHPRQDHGGDGPQGSPDRAQRPRLRALALWREPEPLAGRQRLHGHQARPARPPSSCSPTSTGPRPRPTPSASTTSTSTGAGARPWASCATTRWRRSSRRSSPSCRTPSTRRPASRSCSTVYDAAEIYAGKMMRRRARSGRRLRARLPGLLADGAGWRAGEAGRAQRPQMERRPLHRAVEGARASCSPRSRSRSRWARSPSCPS